MFRNAKKNVSLAYKEKRLAEIAHYEKRIEEALNKRKHLAFFENKSIEECATNPYKFKLQPSRHELQQQEASLSARVSMTLELGMLTIMQSEVNVMVTAPAVRKPVPEDGIWYEVAAECKIDLVSFTITFYAHKPHRKFAPTRYRNVAVTLIKPAHQKELAQSILPKLQLPNLALQVLRSYASAFRSRRTTLLELAERYADKLRMEAMPDGGYRVRFLELLQVEWALENLWSPVVPFCHRMKFEVEYMPKDYIQAIGKLYKQFKDPSLETSERTLILSRIFDICLQAAGPARELQDSFESDPETAGRLHERRTTIDQEPDVPNVDQSPRKKEPIGKENKPQNRKTSMAPPKSIPKRAKKSKPMEKDLNEIRKSVKRAIESESSNHSKKSRIGGSDISKSKPGLKGGRVGINKDNQTADAALKTIKDTGIDANNRETVAGLENNVQNKLGKVSATHAKDTNSADTATSERDAMKKRDGKSIKSKGSGDMECGDVNNAKNNKDVGTSKISEASSKGSKKVAKTNDHVTKSDVNTDNKGSGDTEGDGNIATSEKDVMKKRDGKSIKSKGSGDMEGGDVNNAKNNKDVGTSKISEASSKGSKKDAKTNDHVTKSKDVNTDNNAARKKKCADNIAKINNNKTTVNTKDRNVENNVVTSKKLVENRINPQNEKATDKNTVKSKDTEKEAIGSKKIVESTSNKKATKKVASAKDEGTLASSKHGTKKNEHGDIGNSKEKVAVSEIVAPKLGTTDKKDGKAANIKENNTENKLTKTKKVNDTDTVSRTSSKTVASKHEDGKIKAASKTLKDTNKEDTNSNKVPKEVNADAAGSVREVNDKTKLGIKKPTQNTNAGKQKEGVNSVINKKNVKENLVKQTDKVIAKSKFAKAKPTETEMKIAINENNKEKNLAEKWKVTKPKGPEQTGLDMNKIAVDKTKKNLVRTYKTGENEVLAKKRKTEDDAKNIKNIDNQPKISTADKAESKSNTKPQNTTIILKENPNGETDKEKNSQNTKTKNQKSNMLNLAITKSKIIPISKLQTGKQTKIPDKLNTKIPMMKSKMTFSSLGAKLKMNNLGIVSKGENSKISQKSLPVFKKLAKNPTRMSPRKLPIFKPSAHGFSNK